LREDLQAKNVVVAIDYEAGEKVGFAEDDAVGVGVADYFLAISEGVGDPLAKQRREIGDRLVRDEANGDLRGAGVESGAEGLATLVRDGDEGAGRDIVGEHDVGAVDPNVAGFQAGCAAGRNLYFMES
jgi:hypothetical protein